MKQVEAGRKEEEVAREMGVSKPIIYARRQKYGGLRAEEPKQLPDENARLAALAQKYPRFGSPRLCALLRPPRLLGD